MGQILNISDYSEFFLHTRTSILLNCELSKASGSKLLIHSKSGTPNLQSGDTPGGMHWTLRKWTDGTRTTQRAHQRCGLKCGLGTRHHKIKHLKSII